VSILIPRDLRTNRTSTAVWLASKRRNKLRSGGGGTFNPLFSSSVGANGEKIFTINDTDGNPIKHLFSDTSSSVSGTANSLDSSIFANPVLPTTVSGKNTSTTPNVIVETNSVSSSSYTCEFATATDSTSSGPQSLIFMADVV